MSETKYPHLYSPGEISGRKISNRFVTAPMTRVSADPDGTPNEPMIDYYKAYATGGFGMVISEGTYTDTVHAQGYQNQPGIANDQHIAGWRPIVDAVKGEGAVFIQQLIHAGGMIQRTASSAGAIAPSAVRPKGEMRDIYYGEGPFDIPAEMDQQKIDATIAYFAAAADRAIATGFDGVEIHGANGYIVDQFLTSYTNQRTDKYGGSIENRVRFACEVLRAVRDAVAGRGIVGIRISQTKGNDFDYTWEGGAEDAKVIFGSLTEEQPDYIHISTHKGLETVFGTDRNLADFAKEISGGTVIACGALNEPDRAEGLLARGEADFAAMAKGALADPDLPKKIAAGETPIPFNRDMTSPRATIQNTAAWRDANLAG